MHLGIEAKISTRTVLNGDTLIQFSLSPFQGQEASENFRRIWEPCCSCS